ncbi:hypothetical protein QQM39_10900 [Streptomyces sp. DT2A-34]|uniref:putative T7SS-secreted protein n=1 Tax=Streptomyces sp. DT2A-34 TaxID=3051182 RepID=UPI00265C048E|nr:hypothetical protein [Streptomyces sp. DT2A-34]MDO0911341.1 hypothetical protein [Streptomyces sp. DT2A-34]
MATPATTTVEGYPSLGFDPAPGSPAAVSTLAQDINGTYSKLKAADDILTGIIKGTGGWTGIAADAFTAKVKELPKLLDDATASFQRAAGALLDWQDRLAHMKQQAIAYEDQAASVRGRIRTAESNPDLNLAGQQFPSQEEADQAQRRLDNAIAELNAARRDLDAIIADAKQLLARHDEIADSAAELIKKACEQAPDEPGFWDRLFDGLESLVEAHAQLANEAWDWVKDHANAISAVGDVFSTISTVTGVVGLALDATGIGGVVGVPLGIVSGVTAGVGLGLHLTAKAAGADVSDRTLTEDALGLASFGIGKVASKADDIVEAPVAIYRGLKSAEHGAGWTSIAMTGQDYLKDSTALGYFVPDSATEAGVLGGSMLVPGLGPVVGLGMAFEDAWEKGSEKDVAAAEQRAGQ